MTFSPLCVFLIIILYCHSRKQNNKADTTSQQQDEESKPENLEDLSAIELIEWASDDDPVKDKQHDYFGAQYYAERMANRLLVSNEKRLNISLGLQGEYGSGKSTIIKLMKEKIEKQKPNEYIFCEVSCCGFLDTLSVQQYIIEKNDRYNNGNWS